VNEIPPDEKCGKQNTFVAQIIFNGSYNKKRNASGDFASYCSGIFKAMLPFNKFVNDPVLALK
jgi:hypothetical protein